MTVEPIRPDLTAEQARSLTDKIRTTVTVAHDLIAAAYQGRAWVALGYADWDTYCSAEFEQARMVRLGREERREIVSDLREQGMSTRAIAGGLGVDHATVARDIRTGDAHASPVADATPALVVGIDGKKYTAKPKSNRRALPDAVKSAVFDLTKAVEKVERLLDDDRLPTNKEQIAARNRGDLLRAAETLARALDRLN